MHNDILLAVAQMQYPDPQYPVVFKANIPLSVKGREDTWSVPVASGMGMTNVTFEVDHLYLSTGEMYDIRIKEKDFAGTGNIFVADIVDGRCSELSDSDTCQALTASQWRNAFNTVLRVTRSRDPQI